MEIIKIKSICCICGTINNTFVYDSVFCETICIPCAKEIVKTMEDINDKKEV